MKPSRYTAAEYLLAGAAAFFLLGAAVTVADVVLRATMGLNVPAVIEVTTFSIGLGALLSIPTCYLRRTHVTAKLLSELKPGLFARPLGQLGAVVSVLFAAVLAWVMTGNALEKWGGPELTRDTGLPMDKLLAVVASTLVLSLGASLIAVWRAFGKGK